MRLVSKLGMIRWHYFDYEVIDFKGKSSIITGDNATGKSTIIDALQVLLIANLKTIKFNSSAHEHKTERKLVTYLRGKIGSGQSAEENEGEFLRNEDFTSYLALEIEIFNSKINKPEYYILGVVFDYIHKNKDESHDFFRIDKQRLNDKLFFHEPDMPFTKEQFFYNLKKEGLSFEKYQTVEKYNNDVRHLLGGIKDTFFSLIQKGISFSPITNLRKFIYDYILDAQELDVSMMQDYVEQTNELIDSINTAERQIGMLNEIRERFEKVEQINKNIIIGNYMEKRADYEHLLLESDVLKKKHSQEEELLEENKLKRDNLNLEKDSKNEENDILTDSLMKHNIKVKQTLLNEKIEKIAVEINNAKVTNENIKYKIKTEVFEHDELIKTLKYLNINNDIPCKLGQQKKHLEDVSSSLDFISMPEQLLEFNNHWENGYRFVSHQKYEWDKEIKELNAAKFDVEVTIKQLEKNQILSPNSPQMVLKNLLIREFQREGKNVSVDLLCEVIDVDNPEWRNAVEGYLHTQKFNILVPPGYFNQALQVYENNKYKFNLESVGLVDTEKVLRNSRESLPNSLAEEIIVASTKNYIKPYVNYLLGAVIKCSDVRELRKYNRAITSTCMLYQGYTARQIPKIRYEQPYIGRNAVQVQLKQKKEELGNIFKQIGNISESFHYIEKVLEFTSSKEDRYKRWKDEWTDSDEIFNLEENHSKLIEELYSLDTSEINDLEERIKNNKLRIVQIDTELPLVSESIGNHTTNIRELKEKLKENEVVVKIKKDIFDNYCNEQSHLIINSAKVKWDNEAKGPLEILKNYQSSNKGLVTQKSNALSPLIELRVIYNNKFLSSAEAKRETNEEYDEILYRLEESEIVKYKEKAEEAREKAQQSFREDFIARLKDQIEKARSDFKEMNSILRELKFGTDRYHFKVSPNEDYRDYYDMLNDPNLESGYSIFSETFNDEHGYIVNELFEKISGEDSDKNADLLDYRTYLDFELEVTDESGKTTRYSKVALEKSGGETQVPFYVSILASFYHAYHMGRKEDTFRLVIFDEAFNRMDANRVEEAIKFIQSCGFQTIIVAPTGKVALLAPHFENSMIVMKENYHSFVVPVAMNELLEFKVEVDNDEVIE